MTSRLTLDTNCLINLGKNHPEAPFLRSVLEKHEQGSCEVALVAVSGSERLLGGVRLRAAGWRPRAAAKPATLSPPD